MAIIGGGGMTLKIDNAIKEIERALAGNKPKYANDIYLKNAIRYLQEIKSPSLTDNQQVVLDQLRQIFMKQSYKSKMQAVYIFIKEGMSDEFLMLDRNESNQVLTAFAEWGMEQEAEE